MGLTFSWKPPEQDVNGDRVLEPVGFCGASPCRAAPWKPVSPEQIHSQVAWRAGTFSPPLPSPPAALPCQVLWPWRSSHCCVSGNALG